MHLREYVRQRIDAGETRNDLIDRLAKSARISPFTIKNAIAGARIAKYETAKLISEAIGVDDDGAPLVSIKDLCEPS
jgi:hypothetical protein